MRVGVVGLRMGLHLADWCRKVGLEVVAACDRDPERRAAARARISGTVLVERWQELLEHRLDGVVLANDFDEHAPLAIAFLDRGVHVLSESAACVDAAEGERLIAAADRSSATYSFAENYVAHPHVRLIRQAIEAGELGRISLIEADYLHGMPPAEVAGLIGDPTHWRGRIAPTAYCTHTLSPILALTKAWPVEVSAFSVDEADPRAAVVMAARLSTGALALTRHGFLQGEPDSHWSWISVRGTKALAESVRATGERSWSVRVRTEGWATPEGHAREEERTPPPFILAGEPVARGAEGTVRVLRASWSGGSEGSAGSAPSPPGLHCVLGTSRDLGVGHFGQLGSGTRWLEAVSRAGSEGSRHSTRPPALPSGVDRGRQKCGVCTPPDCQVVRPLLRAAAERGVVWTVPRASRTPASTPGRPRRRMKPGPPQRRSGDGSASCRRPCTRPCRTPSPSLPRPRVSR